MDSPAISVEHVSKKFRLYHEKYMTLKERVIHFGNLPFEEFQALTDISMEIGQGETVGLIGHNGSGKSTLLKCIGGILRPTSGVIKVRGQLAAMLELGAGFNPELSGRDNVYLNATLLGMPKREIDRRFDEIVQFSELEHFIDNQVKFYSSGMYMKLGFAVAVSFEPEVLLVDEVLAVGDERFQLKCLDKIKQFQSDGRTIVIVSHAPDVLRTICDRIFVLDKGVQVGGGPAGEAVRLFRERLFGTGLTGAAPGDQPSAGTIRLGRVGVEHAHSSERQYLEPGEPMTVTVPYVATEPDDVVVALSIRDQRDELVFATDTEIAGQDRVHASGEGVVRFNFRSVPLLDGSYKVALAVRSCTSSRIHAFSDGQLSFEVMNPGKETGMVSMEVSVGVSPHVSAALVD
ncbi:MAG: ABC transporter ATP-binding protein [Actinomycetota bacterium]|nr:ABC transporter ATP-binding protein [Actinomycetota bacterium]